MLLKKRFIFILFFAFVFSARAQFCLTLLDSATAYVEVNRVRSERLTDELIVQLKDQFCQSQIGYAKAYTNAGLLYQKLNQRQKSLEALNEALRQKLLEVDSNHVELIPYYENLFSVTKDFGDYRTAGRYLKKNEHLIEINSSDDDYYNHLIRSAVFFRETGQFLECRSSLDLAMNFLNANDHENDSLKSIWLIESGTLSTITGNYAQADEELTEAIGLLRSDYPKLKARAIDRMAKLKYEEGDFSTSEVELLSNINFKEVHFPTDTLLLVESINNLGLLYYRINDLDNSEKYFSQLSEIGQKFKVLLPYSLNNLGVIYLKRNQLEKAEEVFNESLLLFKETYGTLHPDYSNCLNNIARLQMMRGQTQLALSNYMQVLDHDRVLYGKNHNKYATTLTNLSSAYKELKYYSLAEKFLGEAVKIKKKALGEYHHLFAEGLNDLGFARLEQKDTLGALQLFDSALMIDVRHMTDVFPVLTDKQRALFYNDIIFNLRRFSSFCFSDQYVHTEWAKRALNYFINTKAILFYSSDKLRSVSSSNMNTEIRNQYIRWREKKFELAKAYLLSEKDRIEHKISIQELEEECNALEKILTVNSRSFGDQVDHQFYSWEDISNNLKDSTALLEVIEYKEYQLSTDSISGQGFLDRSRYIGFIIKPNEEIEVMQWEKEINFKRQFDLYKNSLLYNIKDKQSYAAFWEIVDKKLGSVSKLYFAPDGLWHKMNPTVYYDYRSREYVADKYNIVNITSARDLISSEVSIWNKSALIMGNPNFSNLNASMKLNQLPGAETEALDITGILDTNRWVTSTYIYDEATEEKIKRISNRGVVHLATHGFFQSSQENPLLNSGVFLSNSGGNQDGILTAYEAMNLNLEGTQLVVLSACETGLGEVKNGEGVYGLQRSILVAGAQNLIFSLVKVGDQETKKFMELFYNELVNVQDVEEAFFSSRKQFRKEYTKPLDWGAFVLASKH